MNNERAFNPCLPGSRQFTPPKEGGNGVIHHPGHYQNCIWQTRSRPPEPFEIALIAVLEQLFAEGVDAVEALVAGLNQQRMFDRSGQPWTEASFREFLLINGY